MVRLTFIAACISALLLCGCGRQASTSVGGLDRIKTEKTLRVGMEGTYPPFNYQGADGQLTGFEVDFAQALAAKMGVKAKLEPMPFAGLLGALEARRIDVVVNQIAVTPARSAKYGFSKPYTVSGSQIVLRRDDARAVTKPQDLAGKSVGVGLGTAFEAWLRANVPDADVRTYDDDPTKYRDLSSGRIDAVLTDRLVTADLVKSGMPIKASGPTFLPQDMAVAFLPDPALKAALDKAIDELRASGELSAISQRWFGEDVTR